MITASVKEQSEERLRSLGVAINPHLPELDPPSELSPRAASAVCGRAFVLSYLVGIGFKASAEKTLSRITSAGIADHLSPQEHRFLSQSEYSVADRSWAFSLGEACLACAWSLGLVAFDPLQLAPEELAAHFLSSEVRPLEKIEASVLRPYDQLFAQADFHYRLHWAARPWRSESLPFEVSETVVRMRRHAFDWIVGVPDEWDDISLDT